MAIELKIPCLAEISMRATYGRSAWPGPAIKAFYVLVAIICYILTCLKCLWARAKL